MEDPDDKYDSTWDDEYEEGKFGMTETRTPSRNLRAASDMQRFRHMCQNKIQVPLGQHFRSNNELKNKLLESYKLMLDFYGIRLVNEKTGEVQRAGNWKERFENLNRNSHNNLRITRILKCLGILGLDRYQKPLVRFFLEETLVKGTLPQVKQSALDYFMFAVLNKSERKELIKYAFWNFEPKEQFVWCPRKIRRKLLREIAQKEHSSRPPARRGKMHHQTDYKRSLRNRGAQNEGLSRKDPRHYRLSTQNWFH
ncbi:opioid growth factor receptor [Silurus meridionalis]|nr:opioid growth factor receptor [Silurus meridionalis]